MKVFNWKGYEWIDREPWGRMHPDKPWMYYSPKEVKIDDKGFLELSARRSTYHKCVMDIGLISSVKDFHFGTFSVVCKFSTLPYAWDAFWMWGGNWPPEIDVFEGYANKNGDYFKFRFNRPFGFWNVQSNMHYGNHVFNNNDSIKSKTHWFGLKNPAKNFLEYKVEWTPHHVKWWYNGKLVRKTTKNVPQIPQRVILNTGSYTPDALQQDINQSNSFIIKDFKYEPLK